MIFSQPPLSCWSACRSPWVSIRKPESFLLLPSGLPAPPPPRILPVTLLKGHVAVSNQTPRNLPCSHFLPRDLHRSPLMYFLSKHHSVVTLGESISVSVFVKEVPSTGNRVRFAQNQILREISHFLTSILGHPDYRFAYFYNGWTRPMWKSNPSDDIPERNKRHAQLQHQCDHRASR
jgi:hypothetical protein